MLDLTDTERSSLDLITVVHSKNVGDVYFEVLIVGYSGGRDGREVFVDTVDYAIDNPGDEVSSSALLEFAQESLRDAGIVLSHPVWTSEFSGFEHHTRITPRSLGTL